MKKIVFLSKRHFLKTKSDQFLIDFLKEWADVVVLRREDYSSWQLYRAIKREKPDTLLFFATPPSLFHHVLRFPWIRKIFVPMYDGFKPFKPLKEALFRFFGLRALCFSRPTEEYLQSIGLKTLGVRFFPKPQKREKEMKPPYTFFFWQRNKDITLTSVIAVIGEENIKKILYRPDPGMAEEGAPAISGWLSKEDLTKLMLQADFVVAPRKQEGIGMAFLEALALGIPVIAYDDHTMKDYIVPGENGYLFTDKKLEIAPIADFSALNQAYYARWEADKPRIRAFFF